MTRSQQAAPGTDAGPLPGGKVSVTVSGIRKSYGPGAAAVDGVDLAIGAGELLALLGPSGSGKTTLLRVIAGLELPEDGQVQFGGVDVTDLPVQDRQIGFVFQHYALFKHLSVFDNIAYGLRAGRSARPSEAKIRQRVTDLLDLVQLEGLGSRYPAQLSGGQRQRVALARALATNPRVLLLDEPFGALDARVRKDLRRWLRDIHRETGQTTIFVTHDQDEALELADRVAILNRGRLEQVATPEELHDEPASAFVAGFVGDSLRLPVTVLGGVAHLGSRSAVLPAGGLPDGPGTLFVRKGDLTLDHTGEGLPAVVRDIRRIGSTRRLDVELDGVPLDLEIGLQSQAPAVGASVGLVISGGRVFAGCDEARA